MAARADTASADASLAYEARGAGFSVDGRALLSAVDVVFPAGSVSALVGHNGSGKSTLLKLLARQLHTDVGSISLGERPLDSWTRRDFARRVAFLPQQTSAAGGLTVQELVAHGRFPWHGALGRFRESDHDRVDEALRLTGVGNFSGRFVETLSGGERQRAWIAMLIAQESRVLLLDEPISALDIAHQVDVLSLVRDLSRLRKLTTVMVLHDINMAARYADRIFALKQGRLIASGTPDEIMEAETLETIFGLPMALVQSTETGRRFAHVA